MAMEESKDTKMTLSMTIAGSERIINDYLKDYKPKVGWQLVEESTNIQEQGKMVSLSFVHNAIKVTLYSISVGRHLVVSIVTL